MKKEIIRIGTRASKLALSQVNLVIKAAHKAKISNVIFKVIPIINEVSPIELKNQNIKGAFTKFLEDELLKGNIDIAVHSIKDMPSRLADVFILGAVLKRSNRKDSFLSDKYKNITDIPCDATIGTSSIRRYEFLKEIYPNINIIPIRGNIDSRIRKMQQGYCDAIILSHCGLQRLKILHTIKYVQQLNIIPAIGQGGIGLEILSNASTNVKEICHKINHLRSFKEIDIERYIAAKLNISCGTPIGISVKLKLGIYLIKLHYINEKSKKSINLSLEANDDNLDAVIDNICMNVMPLLN